MHVVSARCRCFLCCCSQHDPLSLGCPVFQLAARGDLAPQQQDPRSASLSRSASIPPLRGRSAFVLVCFAGLQVGWAVRACAVWRGQRQSGQGLLVRTICILQPRSAHKLPFTARVCSVCAAGRSSPRVPRQSRAARHMTRSRLSIGRTGPRIRAWACLICSISSLSRWARRHRLEFASRGCDIGGACCRAASIALPHSGLHANSTRTFEHTLGCSTSHSAFLEHHQILCSNLALPRALVVNSTRAACH
jgi:hypothetical protein